MSEQDTNNGPADPEHVTPEVVDRQSSALAVPTDDALAQYLREGHEAVQASDPDEIQRAIVSRILAADTVADVLAPQAVEHARDLLGVPLTIQTIKFNQSDFEEGPGFYAVVEAVTIDDGRRTTFSCGGQNVMAQLYKLAKMGALPCDVIIGEPGRPTAQGYKPLWLAPYGGAGGRAAVEREKETAPS